MPSVTLYPNANGTFSGSWSGTASSPAYSYTEIDEGTSSPNTADFVSCVSDAAYGYYGLTDMPVDLNAVTAVTIKFYAQNASKGTPRKWDKLQVFASDGTTALASAGDVSGGSSSYSLLSVGVSILVTDKTSWDGALAKITTNSGGSGTIYLAAFQIDLTYDVAPSGRLHRAASSLDGLGGVGQQRFNPPLCRRSIWLPQKKQIYIPAFSLAK